MSDSLKAELEGARVLAGAFGYRPLNIFFEPQGAKTKMTKRVTLMVLLKIKTANIFNNFENYIYVV